MTKTKIVRSWDKEKKEEVYTFYEYFQCIFFPFVGSWVKDPMRTNVNGKRMMELASILLNMDEETIITEIDYKSYKEK